jgi:hypothetical protein
MKMFYIDESGDTATPEANGKKYLVLTGAIIDEKDIQVIDQRLRAIKTKFYQNPNIEIKSNFLRYDNPDIAGISPLKLALRNKYDELETEMTKFLQTIPVEVISVVLDKAKFWDRYPSKKPYEYAYNYLLQAFQKYLAAQKTLGICIIDPREGQVEKHYFGNEINDLHESLRYSDTDRACPNVVEKLLFSQSDKTIGIQIADLYCYPIYHIYEYDKKPSDYWRYSVITAQKLVDITDLTSNKKISLR